MQLLGPPPPPFGNRRSSVKNNTYREVSRYDPRTIIARYNTKIRENSVDIQSSALLR